MPLQRLSAERGETMRVSWAQLGAGTLALAVIGGLLLLPGRLVQPAELAAPLVLPHFTAPAPVEAAPVRVAPPMKHRVGHRPAAPVHAAPIAAAPAAQLARVVVAPPVHVTGRRPARHAVVTPETKPAGAGHPLRPHLLPPEPATPAPVHPPPPAPTPPPASPAVPPQEVPAAEPTRVLADALAPPAPDDDDHGNGNGHDRGHGHEGDSDGGHGDHGAGQGHGHAGGGPGHGK
jgi:hypothetical protein